MVIDFQSYIKAKEDEKKRAKRVISLLSRKDSISKLLHNIDSSLGVSILTKHANNMNQIVHEEHMLDKDLLKLVISAVQGYKDNLQSEIDKMDCGGHIS